MSPLRSICAAKKRAEAKATQALGCDTKHKGSIDEHDQNIKGPKGKAMGYRPTIIALSQMETMRYIGPGPISPTAGMIDCAAGIV